MLVVNKNTKVKYRDVDIIRIYQGSVKAWEKPPDVVLTPDLTAFSPEDMGLQINIVLRPPGNSGVPSKLFDADGNKISAPEGQVVITSSNTNNQLAAGTASLYPMIAHNGTWWKFTGIAMPLTGGVYNSSRVGIVLESGNSDFLGFFMASGKSNQRQKIVDNIQRINEFAFIVDPVAKTLELVSDPRNNKIKGTGLPTATTTLHYNLPGGMSDDDVIWPLG
jgi:hypothetical protein